VTAKDLYLEAMQGFDERVMLIKDDQWSAPTPCPEWDVRALVNHLVNENKWMKPLLEGKTVPEVGDAFDGDLLGANPKKAWSEASAEAAAAASEAGVLERVVHVSWADISGEDYLNQMFLDHLIHSWDLARGIGADDTLDPGLVETLYAQIAPREEELKSYGVFGGKVEADPDADTQTKLLAVLGRTA
jgi:uncharacterized protein (TIGR03086 family)